MKIKNGRFLAMGVLAVLLAGCATAPDPYSGYKKVEIKVTNDQRFVIGDKKVAVTEFYDKADFDREALNVMFVVDKDSMVQERTMIELIRIFKGKGYSVKMGPGSKYADAVEKVSVM